MGDTEEAQLDAIQDTLQTAQIEHEIEEAQEELEEQIEDAQEETEECLEEIQEQLEETQQTAEAAAAMAAMATVASVPEPIDYERLAKHICDEQDRRKASEPEIVVEKPREPPKASTHDDEPPLGNSFLFKKRVK